MRKLLLLGLTLTLGMALGQQSTADEGGYKGPAVLSTAGYPMGRYVGRAMDLQWHVGALGTYSTDLTPALTDENGQLVKQSSVGANFNGGFSGVMHGKNSTLSGGLNAGYRYYSGNYDSSDNGVDVSGNLGYATQLNLRTSAQIAAQFYTTGYAWSGGFTPGIDIPIDGVQDPSSTGFDTRTTSGGVSAGVTHMLNRRWGTTASVSGYYTKRDSNTLISSQGWHASGSMNYHISASSSTGMGYSFSNYHSPGDYGDTYSHSLFWQFAKTFENRWTVSGHAGVFYADFSRLVARPLDPLLGAIIGSTETILEPYSETKWGPTLGVTAARAFQSSGVSFYYRRGITPGTAFYASAQSDNVGAQYSITTSRRTNLGFGVNYSHNQTPGGDFTHDYYGGTIGFNYMIGGGFNLTSHLGYQVQSVSGGNLNRDRLYAAVGITYGSGSKPVSLF